MRTTMEAALRNLDVLLTGATGAIGRELIAAITRAEPRTRFTLLIRAGSDGEAAARLRELLGYLRFYHGGQAFEQVRALRGDVTLPRLGLTATTYRRLCRDVTHIVHGAASIKLDSSLDRSRSVNTRGAAEILRLAERCVRLERLAHLSTAYVAGDRSGSIREEELDCRQGFLNAYERSKLEAEVLIREARPRVPITIFRPSIVVGDSSDGHIASLSTIYAPIRWIGSGKVRRLPGEESLRLDLVPLDFVARAVATLLRTEASVGRTYHVTAGVENTIEVGELLEGATAILGPPGTPPLRFGARDGAARPLFPFLPYLEHEKRFDDAALRRDVPALAAERRHPRSYLSRLLGFCLETRWGAAFPWKEDRCLANVTC